MRLFYREYGTEHTDTVVLLHGYLSDSHYWSPVIKLLKQTHRVIAIDLLGFGKSPKPRLSSYSLDTHSQAVIDTLHTIGLPTKITLVGHSMGGLVAGHIASLAPDKVADVVLFNMPVYTTPEQVRETLASTSRLYRTMLYSPIGRFGWPILKYAAASPLVHIAPKTLRPIVRSSSKNSHASRKKSLLHTIEQTNAIDLLTSIPVNTRIVQGVHDRPIYKTNLADHTTSLAKNTSITWIETGHHTLVLRPDFSYRMIINGTL